VLLGFSVFLGFMIGIGITCKHVARSDHRKQ